MAYTADQLFTTETEIGRLLTRLGITARVQDESPEDEDIVAYYVGWATGEVYYYLTREATMELLALNSWVRDQATLGAAYMLTTHGGEPGNAALGAMWEKAEAKLEKIRIDKADVPGLIPETPKGGSPVVSNLTVDMQRQPSVRLNRQTSTGNPAGYPVATDYNANQRGKS